MSHPRVAFQILAELLDTLVPHHIFHVYKTLFVGVIGCLAHHTSALAALGREQDDQIYKKCIASLCHEARGNESVLL